MKDFANRTIRGILSGVLFGASTALGILVGATLLKTTQAFLRTHIPAPLFVAVAGVSRFRLFTVVVAVSFLLLVAPKIATFASRLYRSWSAGLVTGVVPVWFLIALILFLRLDYYAGWRFLGLLAMGLLPVAGGFLLRRRSANIPAAPLRISEPPTATADFGTSRDITFDLPIHHWSEDRLSRTSFVRSVADLILKEKAPVIAIAGGFGEGKTSVLNLIDATLAPRSDLIVVSFSSWLPGDERTLASSLFSTIAEGAKSRYVIPGLAKELKRFARLLAGTMPRVGSEREFSYRVVDLRPFFIWVDSSEEDKRREAAFFRDRFQSYPVELGRFLGWALPKDTVVYQGDPLLTVDRLFPVDELFELIKEHNDDEWLENERESVQWFLQLMARRNDRPPEQGQQNDPPREG